MLEYCITNNTSDNTSDGILTADISVIAMLMRSRRDISARGASPLAATRRCTAL